MNPPANATPVALANPSGTARTRGRGSAEPRVPYRVPCRVRLVDPVSGEVRNVIGETLNVSRGGMSLQISVNAAVGTWVETMVAHPCGEPMFLTGTVAHCRRTLASSFEIGVRATRPRAFV